MRIMRRGCRVKEAGYGETYYLRERDAMLKLLKLWSTKLCQLWWSRKGMIVILVGGPRGKEEESD